MSLSQIRPSKVVRGPPGISEGVPADDDLAAAEDSAPEGEGAVVDDGYVAEGHDGQVHSGDVAGHVEHVLALEVLPTPVQVVTQDQEGEGVMLGSQVGHRV